MEKMTNVIALSYVLENCEVPADVQEKLESMKASYEKRSANRKPSKKQAENASLRELVVEALSDGGSFTISELIGTFSEFEGFTSQKMSALLSPLVKAGIVVKTYDKKTAYFSKA